MKGRRYARLRYWSGQSKKAGRPPGFWLDLKMLFPIHPLGRNHVHFTVSGPRCQCPLDFGSSAHLGLVVPVRPRPAAKLPVNPARYTQLLFRDATSRALSYYRLTSELSSVRFEDHRPVRRFPVYPGKRAHEGNYWFTRSQRHVRCESRFEFIALMLLDFCGQVVAVASNPFWILWPKGARPQRHAPDFFARLRDGTALVVDVHPQALIDAEVAVRHERTQQVCAQLGWGYGVFAAIDPVVERNILVLNGFGHPRFAPPAALRTFLLSATDPQPARPPVLLDCLVDDCCRGTDHCRSVVLSGLYHLMWQQELHLDLARPLGSDSEVWR